MMRTSPKKLHKFSARRHERRAHKHQQSSSLDEQARARQLDNVGMTSSPADPKLGVVNEILRGPRQKKISFQKGATAISKSAPLFAQKKPDSAETKRGRPDSVIGPSPSRKFTSYVLPTPDETKIPSSGKIFNEVPQSRQVDFNLRHSSPVDLKKYEKLWANHKSSGPIILDPQSVVKESNNSMKAIMLPPPISEGHSSNQPDPSVASYAKKAKRQAFSGPLTGKPWTNNPNLTASGPIISSPLPPFSGSLLRSVFPQPTSTAKLPSSHITPNFVSSPKISELHELPRPPAHLVAKRPFNHYGYSGPLISKSHEMSTYCVPTSSIGASKLPAPPLGLSSSYSIPAGNPMEAALHVPLDSSQISHMAEDISSPPAN